MADASQSKIEEGSAFRIPSNDEIFVTREAERLKINEEKNKYKQMKIWDKKTAVTATKLSRVKDNEIPACTIEKRIKYKPQQRALIDAAMSIVKARPPTLKEVSKVSTQEFIDQKKEMFLVQMGHEIIMREIEMFRRNAKEKEEALKQSEDRLLKDQRELSKNQDDNRKDTEKILLDVEKLESTKREFENNLKNTNQQLSSLESDIKKNNELKTRLQKLEEFFKSISPDKYIDDYNKAFEAKKAKAEDEFIKKSIKEDEEDFEKGHGSVKSKGSNKTQKIEELKRKFKKMLELDQMYAIH